MGNSLNEWELWVAAARLAREHGARAGDLAEHLVATGAEEGRTEREVIRARIGELDRLGLRWKALASPD